ncbi:MAG TPA: YIP1 family protein [Candidatus Sulfotelmatobacter sp.]|nr:YIP1 family protein [Candidatus Sulfotelmatobacter sp.]
MAAAPVPPAAVPVPTPEAAPLSEGARLLNTFIAPSKTFTDLNRSASWWGPWIVISIFSLLFIYTMGRQIGFEQISRNQIAHSKRADQFDKLPADQQASQIKFSSNIIRFAAFGSPLLVMFYFLIATVVLWATFNFGAGADAGFGKSYAVFMYGSLPGIVGAILGIISMFAGVNPEGFDINNPVGTNLAYYLDPETTGKFIHGMASAFDVISIWSIVLMGIGFACTSKVKRSTAITIVAVWFFVYKLAGASIAAAFS